MTAVENMIIFFVLRMAPGATVRLKAEKPTAISSAHAPAIEIVRGSAFTDPFVRRIWEERGRRMAPRIPFPLQGRLDKWMKEHKETAKQSPIG